MRNNLEKINFSVFCVFCANKEYLANFENASRIQKSQGFRGMSCCLLGIVLRGFFSWELVMETSHKSGNQSAKCCFLCNLDACLAKKQMASNQVSSNSVSCQLCCLIITKG